MQSSEKQSAFEPKKLPIEYKEKEIYQQFGKIEEFYLFLSNPLAKNFPIVLVGDWSTIDPDHKILEIILGEFSFANNTVIFLTHLGNGDFEVNIFTLKTPDEVPLYHTGPIHSAHLLEWDEGGTLGIVHINYDNIRKIVSENVANLQK